MNTSFRIKLRKKGEKAFWFLSGKGGLNRLRIHAATFADKSNADTALSLLLGDNPEYEGKVTS